MGLSCTVCVWDGVKRAHEIDRTTTRHFGEKDALRFLNIILYDEVDPKSMYDSR